MKATSSLIAIVAIAASQLTVLLAAPVSSPGSAREVSSECRACLAEQLAKIGACNTLPRDTPVLPLGEKNQAKIEKFKADHPEAVNCLCQAASEAQGPQGWVDRCDSVCLGSVEKNQKIVLSTYAEIFSCAANGEGKNPTTETTAKPASPRTPTPAEMAKTKPAEVKVTPANTQTKPASEAKPPLETATSEPSGQTSPGAEGQGTVAGTVNKMGPTKSEAAREEN